MIVCDGLVGIALVFNFPTILQAFFVAVRAKGITKSAALELWDHLEKLERDWIQLRQPSEEAIQAVGAAYRLVFERLGHCGRFFDRDLEVQRLQRKL